MIGPTDNHPHIAFIVVSIYIELLAIKVRHWHCVIFYGFAAVLADHHALPEISGCPSNLWIISRINVTISLLPW